MFVSVFLHERIENGIRVFNERMMRRMKWIGLIGSGVIAVTIWSLLFFIIFKDDSIENQEAQADVKESLEEEAEIEEEQVEDEVHNDTDTTNVVNKKDIAVEDKEELTESLNSSHIEKAEPKVHIVRNGDAIAYGKGISIDDLLEGMNVED